jgi:hypothetical protein
VSFAAFCLCHLFDVRARLALLELRLQRERITRERRARFARLFTAVAAGGRP